MNLDCMDNLISRGNNEKMDDTPLNKNTGIDKPNEIMVEEIMQTITITTYPNGQKFFKTQIWDKNKGAKKTFKPKGKAKKKKIKEFKLKNKEEH